MSSVTLPVTRPAGRALVVAVPSGQSETISLLRRLGTGASPVTVPDEASVGRLTINRVRREVLVDTSSVDVTGLEFDLLWLLVRRAGEVATHQSARVRMAEIRPVTRRLPLEAEDRPTS